MRLRTSLLVIAFILGFTSGGAGTAAAADPVGLSLAAKVQADGTVLLTATATDARQGPVPDATIRFQVKTTFGWLTVAEATTNRAGEARAVLPQVPLFGEVTAEADAGERTLHAAKWIDRATPPAPATRPGYDVLSELSPQPGFISPYPVPLEVILLAIVLGGIWATYVYLVSVLVKIRRASAGPGPAGWGSRESQWR